MSSELYSPANREVVLDLFDYKDDIERAQLNEIMTRMYVCLSITNSDKIIDVDQTSLQQYVGATYFKSHRPSLTAWMQ